MKRVIFTISEEELIYTDSYCKENRYDRSELIRLAVKEFITNHEKKTLIDSQKVKPTLEPPSFSSDVNSQKRAHCDAPFCRSMEGILVEGVGYSDEGEVKKQMYLCKFHIARAKRNNEEIKEV